MHGLGLIGQRRDGDGPRIDRRNQRCRAGGCKGRFLKGGRVVVVECGEEVLEAGPVGRGCRSRSGTAKPARSMCKDDEHSMFVS